MVYENKTAFSYFFSYCKIYYFVQEITKESLENIFFPTIWNLPAFTSYILSHIAAPNDNAVVNCLYRSFYGRRHTCETSTKEIL